MVPYAVLYSYFLLVSMTPFYIQGCKVSIDQNPRELNVVETTNLKFTCTVTSDCNISSSYVEKGTIILAWIPAEKDPKIDLSGTVRNFTATINKTGTGLGTYYCGVSVNDTISFLGCGTHVYSGGPSIGTKTAIAFAILWACVGMIYKEL